MKLGISVGHAGARMELPLARIQRAEALGFDSVWASETYSSDAITPLAYIAARTERIRLEPASPSWRRARPRTWPCAPRPSTPWPAAAA
jgi:hypothetical protein